jgi:hypothetical protein
MRLRGIVCGGVVFIVSFVFHMECPGWWSCDLVAVAAIPEKYSEREPNPSSLSLHCRPDKFILDTGVSLTETITKNIWKAFENCPSSDMKTTGTVLEYLILSEKALIYN